MQGDGSSYVLVVASYGGHAASVVVVVSYTWRKGNINIITCTDKITKQAYQEVNAKKVLCASISRSKYNTLTFTFLLSQEQLEHRSRFNTITLTSLLSQEQIKHSHGHLSVISGADKTLSWSPLFYLRGR